MIRLGCAIGAVAVLLVVGVGIAAGQGGADLAITIKAGKSHSKPHRLVTFSVTATDRGPGSVQGLVINIRTKDGLSRPKLSIATPDTLTVSCQSPTLGAPPVCTAKPVPPVCSRSGHSLSCRYKYEITPSASDTIIVTAVTGTTHLERAAAGVSSGASDPDLQNNKATATVRVRG